MIDRIVFVHERSPIKLTAKERRKVWAKNQTGKGWHCAGCGKPVALRELGRLEQGSSAPDGGRWWVKGDCPHCGRRCQWSKSGTRVLTNDTPGLEVRTTIIRRKGERR